VAHITSERRIDKKSQPLEIRFWLEAHYFKALDMKHTSLLESYMRILGSLILALVATFALSACNSTDRSASSAPAGSPVVPSNAKPPETIHADGARRITVPEVQELLAKGQAVIIDVRNQPSFDQAHIRGAKLIPSAEVADRIGEFPRDKTIVTYCS